MRARYIIGREGSVDAADRGLAYGDGIFETILLIDGSAPRLELHLDRMRLGCQRLRLPSPDPVELRRRIAEVCAGIHRGSLKIIVTRGTGPRGYEPPADAAPTVVLLADDDLPRPPARISAVFLELRLGENEKLAGIKHLNRLEQVLARLELRDLDADEGVMLSASGTVIGGTSRNLFAVFGNEIRTPAVTKAGIAGVMRRIVLEHCAATGTPVFEGDILPEELLGADEIFMTNALVGVQSVSRLDTRAFDRFPTADGLREAGP